TGGPGYGRAQSPAAPWGPEVLEELRIGVEHQHIALVLEARAVGVEAAVEGVELRVLAERPGVDGRGLGVAVALDALRVAVRLGDDHLALAVRARADLLSLRESFRAQLLRDALAPRVHPPVDGLAALLGQLDALEPHVDDLN